MAWIESHQSLLYHPKTIQATDLLHCNRYLFIGHIHALWWWALDVADFDGNLPSNCTDQVIAVAAGWKPDKAKEFVSALTIAGFIDESDEGHRALHDWYEYAGKLNAKRAANKDRMKSARAANVQRTTDARATHVQGLPTNQQNQPTEPTLPTIRTDAPAILSGMDEVGYAGEYVKHFEKREGKYPPFSHVADAKSLERDFGFDVCIQESDDTDWQYHPNYLRKRLVDKSAKTAVAAAAGGARAPSLRYDS